VILSPIGAERTTPPWLPRGFLGRRAATAAPTCRRRAAPPRPRRLGSLTPSPPCRRRPEAPASCRDGLPLPWRRRAPPLPSRDSPPFLSHLVPLPIPASFCRRGGRGWVCPPPPRTRPLKPKPRAVLGASTVRVGKVLNVPKTRRRPGPRRSPAQSVAGFAGYSTSRTLATSSMSRRITNGSDPVVAIGVGRGGVGRDNGIRQRRSGLVRRH
jgi:hypothetical protein